MHKDVGLVIGLVRDVFNDDVDALILDSREAHDELVDYLKDFAPEMRSRVKLYNDPMPVFELTGSDVSCTLETICCPSYSSAQTRPEPLSA